MGFKVETYVASEIDDESIAVSLVNHEGIIVHVDDVRFITREHVCQYVSFSTLPQSCLNIFVVGIGA